ncbi:hypothetical protein TrLO_g2258 [Triparma laevis f. longispina]|uniref:diaminopimelate epimerase n=1 Tax=Triparma laevis f. longispina TaxID=1714387 RepID=A0A9W7C8D0_9STRA|nr:hypothetical protein TrLO_g2258 [Triparma laevis f. longispina]
MKTAFLLLFCVTLTHAYHFSSFGSLGLKRLHSHSSHPPSHPPSTSALSAERTFAFSKYHGLGNDFVLVNDLDKDAPSLTSEESAKICDRNFGVGGDGLIFAHKSKKEGYDFKMTIYNSDGTEPEMCGNGIRALAQFVVDETGLSDKLPVTFNIDTLAGPILPQVNEDRSIRVDMGYPIFTAAEIPTTLAANYEDGGVVEQTVDVGGGKTVKVSCVSMGNPHCVVFNEDKLIEDEEFNVVGAALESHDVFPANTNVEFVYVDSPSHLTMKVFERGAGPTLACGTGACALVVSAVRAGKIPSAKDGITVTLPGGDLVIHWAGEGEKVYMTGPAVMAFKGDCVVDLVKRGAKTN